MQTRTEPWWLEADDAISEAEEVVADDAASSCESSEKVALYELDFLDQEDIARVINDDIKAKSKAQIDDISYEFLSVLAKQNKSFQQKLGAVTFIYQSNINATFFPRRRKKSLAAEVLSGCESSAVKQILNALNKTHNKR